MSTLRPKISDFVVRPARMDDYNGVMAISASPSYWVSVTKRLLVYRLGQMEPSEHLKFSAQFECGNLRRAIQVIYWTEVHF